LYVVVVRYAFTLPLLRCVWLLFVVVDVVGCFTVRCDLRFCTFTFVVVVVRCCSCSTALGAVIVVTFDYGLLTLFVTHCVLDWLFGLLRLVFWLVRCCGWLRLLLGSPFGFLIVVVVVTLFPLLFVTLFVTLLLITFVVVILFCSVWFVPLHVWFAFTLRLLYPFRLPRWLRVVCSFAFDSLR